jgi:hypothetical protein
LTFQPLEGVGIPANSKALNGIILLTLINARLVNEGQTDAADKVWREGASHRPPLIAALLGGETMDEVNTFGAGIALAVTLALISALCAVAFVLVPDATLDFFSAFMHGLDLKTVKAATPLSFGKVLYGIIGLSIVGFIAGFVFAWTYNVISRQ